MISTETRASILISAIMLIYSKIPPIGGITAVLILCVVLISRFKSTASYVSVLSLADTTDVCHQDLVLA